MVLVHVHSSQYPLTHMYMYISYIIHNTMDMHNNTARYCIICFGMYMRLGITPHDSIQMDLNTKALFNENIHILVWECPKAFRP